MDPSYSWIYLLFFLIIPLSRIIPRLIAKRRQNKEYTTHENKIHENFAQEPELKREKPRSKDMQVLGALHNGANTFEKIQKNLQIDNKELDDILEDLENRKLLKVVHKQGMFGPKIELYSTDKGFKEYYS